MDHEIAPIYTKGTDIPSYRFGRIPCCASANTDIFSFKHSKITFEFDPCSITYYFTITIVANASKLKEEISGDCSDVKERAACNSRSVLFGVKSCQVLPLLIGVPALHPANVSERMSKAATLNFNCCIFRCILRCQFQRGL